MKKQAVSFRRYLLALTFAFTGWIFAGCGNSTDDNPGKLETHEDKDHAHKHKEGEPERIILDQNRPRSPLSKWKHPRAIAKPSGPRRPALPLNPDSPSQPKPTEPTEPTE